MPSNGERLLDAVGLAMRSVLLPIAFLVIPGAVEDGLASGTALVSFLAAETFLFRHLVKLIKTQCRGLLLKVMRTFDVLMCRLLGSLDQNNVCLWVGGCVCFQQHH